MLHLKLKFVTGLIENEMFVKGKMGWSDCKKTRCHKKAFYS